MIAQNDNISTNYVKAKIDKTQQDSKSVDRDEKIKCSKLVPKELNDKSVWLG